MSFESGLKLLSNLFSSNKVQRYYADTADPLHAAFPAKAAIHAGPFGLPMVWSFARSRLEKLTDTGLSAPAAGYIHIPFCQTRCLYCMFYQNPYREEALTRYVDALIEEMQLWVDRPIQTQGELKALYLGGGTPTLLSPDDLVRLMEAAGKYLPLSSDCEITLEGRVHDITDELMDAASASGINRMSLGVQSFQTQIRRKLQRLDDRESVLERLQSLSKWPDIAVVIDLLYGLPEQTPQLWEDDVRTALDLPIDGIDCYQLNLFERSPLAKQIKAGKFPAAATLAQAADLFAIGDTLLEVDGRWSRISNTHWRRTEKERNIYNSLGKGACDCLAFGCGAGGKIAGHAFMQERKLAAWHEAVAKGHKPVFVLLAPTDHWHLLRTVACAVEQGEFSLEEIGERFGVRLGGDAGKLLNQWTEAGLLIRSGERYRPTRAGRFWHVTMAQFLSNTVARDLAARKS